MTTDAPDGGRLARLQRRGSVRYEPEILRNLAKARIAWVLDHPDMSDWLKQALRSAMLLDPVAVQNDIEMLRHLMALRASAEVEIAVSGGASELGGL